LAKEQLPEKYKENMEKEDIKRTEKWEYTTLYEEHGDIYGRLNKLGQEGWEAYAQYEHHNAWLRICLKRKEIVNEIL
jgi:DNA-binding PadR family transcriptional regulator